MIPKQLQKKEFRFALLQSNGKIPIEKDWQKTNNYTFDNPKLLQHIEKGGNYGILTGIGGFIVLDFDDFDAWNEWKIKLPKTFAVKTAKKQLIHLYYLSNTTENFPVKNKEGKTLLDFKGIGGQVVAPGSMIDGRSYEIYKDMELTELPEEILIELKKDRPNKVDVKGILEGVEQGSRNESLFKLACSLRAKNITKNDALALLDAANNKSNPKLSTTELVTIRDSAYKYKIKEKPKIINDQSIKRLLHDKYRKEATEELVKEIKKKYVIYTTRDDEHSECWIYEDGIYNPEAHTYIKEFVRIKIEEWYTGPLINEVIAKIEADTYIDQDTFFSKQNKYPNLIPVMNGILNIDTQELTPHTPEYFFFNKLPVNYIPDVDCPFIKLFLEEVLPDEESIMTIQEFYGSCLLKEYRYEKCLMVTGTGSNGKGKTIELLKYLLGIENCAEISPQAIETDQFAMGELVNKMVNISADINNSALNNTGSFKSLTGRDLIMAARKYKTRVKFINYAKMIFSANEIPDTKDITDGFFRRWIILDFPYKFLDEKDIIGKTEEEMKIIKPKDPEIINKLTTEEELTGFLNWCLKGYKRLKQNKNFSNSQTIENVRNTWIRKANSVQAFIMDCVEEDYDSYITKSAFKMFYIAYCRRHKIKQMSDRNIGKTLMDNYNVFEEKPYIDEKQTHVWKGIKFLNFGIEK